MIALLFFVCVVRTDLLSLRDLQMLDSEIRIEELARLARSH